ncbi:MAG: hypothetical protein AB7O67_10820 [Vicinamibacterales bacterium]
MTRSLALAATVMAGLLAGPMPRAWQGPPPAAPTAPQGNQTPARPGAPADPDTDPFADAAPEADPDAAPPSTDPAAVQFTTDAGLLLVPVKPTATADYEAAIGELHRVLYASSDDVLRGIARGWVVYKATEPDAKGNVIYVHMIAGPVAEADYRPSRLLDAALAEAPEDLLLRYRDAIAGAPSKLSLAVLADFDTPPPPPGNETPDGPATPPPPGNVTPPKPPGR